MKKLVFALGLTVVVLAGVVVWFAHELDVERGTRSALEAPRAVIVAPVSVARASELAPRSPARISAPAPEPAKLSPAESGRHFEPAMFPANSAERQALAREHLRQLTDPPQRAAMAVDGKSVLRWTYVDLAKKVGLSPDEETRFLDVMVELQLKSAEVVARCQVEPSCDMTAAFSNTPFSLKQTQIDFLGQERFDRFARYEDALPERRAAYVVRERLSAGQGLSDARTAHRFDRGGAAQIHR